MSTRLKSYVMGKWVEGTGAWRQLIDPTTEELIAEASTEGVDLAGAVAYARGLRAWFRRASILRPGLRAQLRPGGNDPR